jgi:transcriptional regulator with XRE-family HTH domain
MKRAGLTNAELAAKLNCSRHAVWRWRQPEDSDSHRRPSPEVAAKLVKMARGAFTLADVLGV